MEIENFFGYGQIGREMSGVQKMIGQRCHLFNKICCGKTAASLSEGTIELYFYNRLRDSYYIQIQILVAISKLSKV